MLVKDKYFEGKSVNGEVGIEIELEGESFPDSATFVKATNNIWTWHSDGSLRGKQNGEIVLAAPVPREAVKDTLAIASDVFKATEAKLIPSTRTGVHIHINVRELTMEQTYIFMLMWLLFENPLVRYCGEDRQGNLFCLRSSDAEAYISELEKSIRDNDFKVLFTDQLRYSAMNPKALCQYGSLEFRCLRTPNKIKDIEKWVDILLAVKDFSLTIKDPTELLQRISLEGGDVFAEEAFGELLESIPADDWVSEIYDGLRRIQPAVYAREWGAVALDDIVFNTELPKDLHEAKKRGALSPREVIEFNL